MAARTNPSGAAAERVVNALVEIISDTLKKGICSRCPALERSKYVSVRHVPEEILGPGRRGRMRTRRAADSGKRAMRMMA